MTNSIGQAKQWPCIWTSKFEILLLFYPHITHRSYSYECADEVRVSVQNSTLLWNSRDIFVDNASVFTCKRISRDISEEQAITTRNLTLFLTLDARRSRELKKKLIAKMSRRNKKAYHITSEKKCIVSYQSLRQHISSSSSSYVCQGVRPLVDPFRSHVSRSLFRGLPRFLLPVGE